MDKLVGKSYHLRDSFFSIVQDSMLMSNKENGGYRPHFFFFKDTADPNIFWAVPQSTQVSKYSALFQKKIAKSGRCDTIVLGKFGGKENAFLLQNMFPVIEKFVEHEHTINGKSVTIHHALVEEITSKGLHILKLHKKGYHLVFPDIDRIYDLMKEELRKTEEDVQ